MKIVNILFLSLIIITNVSAMDIGFKSGVSSFQYAEVGVNNKDDLYHIDSVLIGVFLKEPVNIFDLRGTFSAQLPYNLSVSDAFGSDGVNYLENLYYYGINLNISLGYDILKNNNMDLSVAILINYDYFYFKELVSESNEKYSYLVLGSGLELTGYFPFGNSFGLEIDAIYAYNFLPLYSRGISFKWSDNMGISIGLVYQF